MLGAIVSATDPVAALAVLAEVNAPEHLSVLIDGESLLNDGAAFVIFTVAFEALLGVGRSGGEVVVFFVQQVLGGVGIGVAFGIGGLIVLQLIFYDDVGELAATVVTPFLAFYTAEGEQLVPCARRLLAFYSDVELTLFEISLFCAFTIALCVQPPYSASMVCLSS